MKKYIVDRFEEDFVVLEKEDGGTIDVKNLIEGAKEGDVVIFENGEYRIDKELTKKRKALIEEKIKKLFDNR